MKYTQVLTVPECELDQAVVEQTAPGKIQRAHCSEALCESAEQQGIQHARDAALAKRARYIKRSERKTAFLKRNCSRIRRDVEQARSVDLAKLWSLHE